MLNKHYKPPLLIHTWDQEDNLGKERRHNRRKAVFITVIIFNVLFWILFFKGCSYGSEIIAEPNIAGYSLNQWCTAIYIAEGGAKTAHPYGILAHYRHTTPLQACQNTIKHKYSQWKRQGQHEPFIAYLAAKYCPVGCSNDNGSNKNWEKNVQYWLERG